MSLQKLLSFSLLAIIAGLSLRYSSASNMIHNLTRSPPTSPLSYAYDYFRYNASATKEIVSEIEKFHTDHFVDSRFTTENLALYPEGKAVVEFLRESLQPVVTLNSDIEFFDCGDTIESLETCAVWSISADINLATARTFLHSINDRVHRCVKTLDKVIQHHKLLEQLMHRLVDYQGFVIDPLPLDFDSEHEVPSRDVSSRPFSLRLSTFLVSRRLREWKDKNAAAVESLARVREFLVGNSEELATVVARYDVVFAKDLSVLLRNCRKEHPSLWY